MNGGIAPASKPSSERLTSLGLAALLLLMRIALIFAFTCKLMLVALACWVVPGRAEAQIVPSGQRFECTPVAIWDGDGPIWCAEGPKVRIAGVAAREIDGSCRHGQPCPPVSGVVARDRMVQLFGGPTGRTSDGHVLVRSATMTCISDGSAGGSRTAAWCRSPVFGDLSCAVVRAGGAVRWARFWRRHEC